MNSQILLRRLFLAVFLVILSIWPQMIASGITIGADGKYGIGVRAADSSSGSFGSAALIDPLQIKTKAVSTTVAGQIEVTRPAKDESFNRGQTIYIHWNMPLTLGGSVRILLLNSKESVAHTIAASVQNTGNYDWVIPENTPFGPYWIKVQQLGSEASDVSEGFFITDKPLPVEKSAKVLRFISPTENQVVQPPNKPIPIVWETTYTAPFTVDLLRRQADGQYALVRGLIRDDRYLKPISNFRGLNRYSNDFYINSEDTSARDGWYKLRISLTPDGSGEHAFSPKFQIERGTIKKQVVLEPDEIVDRFSDWSVSYSTANAPEASSTVRQGHESKPGLARVGFCYAFTPYNQITGSWNKHIDVFRSKIRFPLSAYKPTAQRPAQGKILKAVLRLVSQASAIGSSLEAGTLACGGKLYFLSKPWNFGEGNCLNASGVLLAALPNQTECYIDVTEAVNNICRQGGLPNYGFLLTSKLEQMPEHSITDTCITWYKGYLILDVEVDL